MGNKKYSTVQIPENLAHLVDGVIEAHDFSYRSRAEFVVDAIRRRIEELKKQEVEATV